MNRKILLLLLACAMSITSVVAKPLKHFSAEKAQKLEEVLLNSNDNDVDQELIALNDSSTKTDTKEILLNTNFTEANDSNDDRIFKIYNLKGAVTRSMDVDGDGDAEVVESAKSAMKSWADGDYATGRWFGARPLFEDHGVTINSSLLYSPFMKTHGGGNDAVGGKGYSLYNLSVTVDTEKAKLWKGGTFFALYQLKKGYGLAGPNGAMGDWMYFDGWEGRELSQISEIWYQQKLFDGKVRLKAGKQDANVDFAFLNSGWNFMNLAFSVNPTIPMPTYPDQAGMGLVAEINPKEWLSLRNGIYSKSGVPFNITELEVKPMIKGLPGRYSVGAWEMADRYGMGVADSMDIYGNINYNNFYRNYGAYAQFEQMVYKENKSNENDMQGLVVFGQFGISPSNKNDMSRYVGGGLSYTGLIPKRDKDIVGLACASGTFARRLGDLTGQVGDETVLEAFYRYHVTSWFYFQPDVQLIMNPNGTYPNSVAIGVRSVIAF